MQLRQRRPNVGQFVITRLCAPLIVTATILAPTVAHAIILAEDHFLTSATPLGAEYAVGNLAGQNPSNLGFSGAWFTSTGASPTVEAASLNYSDANFPAETGGRVLSPTGNSRVHRLLAPAGNPFEATDAGTLYMSLLLQTGTINGYRAFEMHNGGNDDAQHRTLQIGLSSFGDFPISSQFGFRVNNDGAFDASLGAENSLVHLFLVKFDLTTANDGDAITVWNNPNISSLASDPAGGVTLSGFNFAADRLGAGHFNGTQYGLDELRIGTTLQDVLTDFLYCDVNGNGVCNSTDVGIISDHMFLSGAFEDGDIDGSGSVDHVDFRLFKDHPQRVVGFDPAGAASLAIPEPASVLLLMAALLMSLASRAVHRPGRGRGRPGSLSRASLAAQVSLVGVMALVCCGLGKRNARRRRGGFGLVLALIAGFCSSAEPVHAAAQDLLNDNITFSGKTLNLRPYVTMPGGFANVIAMTHKPSDTRMFVVTEEGGIFVVNEDATGSTTPALWFNAASALQTATGRSMNYTGSQQGLQSVAFHPDFEAVGASGYGKLYTTMLENRPGNPNSPDFFYLGNSTYGGGGADGVLAEWTYNHGTGQVDPNSYRELFRTNMPNYDHPIKLAQFNPYAEPGDEDYGLLYLTHGDSNNQDSLNDDPQDRGDVLGKMLRINPLQSGGDRYTVPTVNPYFTDSSPSPSGTGILGEVYAYGMRNPHNFSFNSDDQGNVHILVGDIGRSNMEEINLIVPGGNYGWTKREGTFVHLQGNNYPADPGPDDAGYITGVTALPGEEVSVGVGPDGNRYIFPVAQYDHNGTNVNISDDYTATSVASGFVIRNGSDPALDNQFVFHNFAFNHGDVYHTDLDEMLNAVTQLDPNDTTRDEPGELQPAQLFRFHLALDHDNNPDTPPQTNDNLNTLLGTFRNDGRYGEGLSGEMYISTKSSAIYLVANTVPDNQLTLSVDRGTGEMTITNSTGSDVDVDRVSVYSPAGSLLPGRFQSLQSGWTVSPANSTRSLTQANDAGSFELTDANSAFVGSPYNPQLVAFDEPPGEDVQFLFTTAGPAGRDFVGDVVYVGESTIFNTIVMSVNVATGEAVLLNRTPFPQEVELYTITSPSESLNTGEWNSFEAQGVDDGDWLASPPEPDRITELQEDGTTTFDDQSSYSLGNIYLGSVNQDLEFEFLLAGESTLRAGQVVYFLPGDYNGDFVVDAADYTVWRDSMGQEGYRLAADGNGDLAVGQEDYVVWSTFFGQVWSGAGAASISSTSVPEPTSWTLIAIAAAAAIRRRPRAFPKSV
jgi:hypothetical protein